MLPGSVPGVHVLIESDIGFVHAAGTDVVPAIGADKISEVLVDAVAEAFLDIRGRGLVIVTGQVLDARPRGVGGDIGVLGWGLPSPGLARPRKRDALGPTGSEEVGIGAALSWLNLENRNLPR